MPSRSPWWRWGPPPRFFDQIVPVSGLLGSLIYSAEVLAFGSGPVAIGVAILRYRLYDIDIIVRSALLYATLTATLALLYFGSVVLLQQLLRVVSGQESDPGIIISTLVIAALFNPCACACGPYRPTFLPQKNMTRRPCWPPSACACATR